MAREYDPDDLERCGRMRDLEPTIVDDLGALEPHLEAWSALAAGAGRPFSLPGWLLAWWRHARPARAALRVVLVHDRGELVAVAPYFAHRGRAGRTDYRLLGSGWSHRGDPPCRPGREAETGRAVAAALAGARPRPSLVSFEGVDAASAFPAAVAAGWPGRARTYHAVRQPAPVLTLPAAGFDAWMGSRSANFRQQMRQTERRLAAAGGHVRVAEEPGRAVEAFAALHAARWAHRGGSALPPATGAALLDAARGLGPDRLRLWCAEVDGRLVSVQVFVAAGGTLAYWNGGWDEGYAHCRPALATILAAVRDAAERGEREIDFGGGDDPYKRRFAGDSPAAVTWSGLFPPGARYPVTRLQLAPSQLGWWARGRVRRLPPAAQQRVRRVLRRA